MFRQKPKTNEQDPYSNSVTGRFGRTFQAKRYRLEISDSYLSDGSNNRLGRHISLMAVTIVQGLALIMITILAVKIYHLQVVKGDYYSALSEGNRVRVKRLQAQRGIIYDRNQVPLVHNIANFMLYLVPADLPTDPQQRQSLLRRLSNIVNTIDLTEVETNLQAIKPGSYESYQPLFVTDNIDYQKALLVYLESIKMSGVFLDSRNRREYVLPSLSFSHFLGYTGKINPEELLDLGSEYNLIDYVGKSGLEKFYESELRGISGVKQIEVDAFGKEKKIISQTAIVDGNSLVLSIDIASQVKLETIIKAYLEKSGFKRASAIVMDPNNGEVLALISMPSYDNNLFAKGISTQDYQYLLNHEDRPLFARATSGEFPSGSVIKPVTLVAALDAGVVTDQTSFLSAGGLRISQWFFPDWKYGGHGQTDARKAIAESVNTYFYIIGGGYQDFQGLGIDKMMSYFKLFGLGSETGIDVPGEADGFLPSREWKETVKKEKWYIGDTYHVAIGQGDLIVTPLQVAYYTAFFANGGKLYRPHLVKNILTANSKLLHAIDTAPIKGDFLKSADIQVVREGMRQAVTAGSAIRLNSLPVEVAGKTGTAQWSTKKAPHAWFTGFAPYSDPEIVITILVEEGEEGSRIAVPIADEFLKWYFDGKKPDTADDPVTAIIPISTSTEISY